ncbi:aminomethyltransferase family protein [Mycetocola spongiae]|uniref:aminomethyl transferase family protein n=1 Tax=Mycetocola spongiae TaxID=2859226 RepID=UPI001CF23E70|nr:aminomethyl transferase family protein [Mycetocola spongiae]UCR88464.1 aminomethyl transferase family protein [Mycetocola spongiae]
MTNTTSAGYRNIRDTAAAYRRGDAVLALGGPDRFAALSYLLAKRTEFAEPGTLVESAVLNAEGGIQDVVLALIGEDEVLLVSELPEFFDVRAALAAGGFNDVTCTPRPDIALAAIEGPASWRAIEPLIELEVSSLLLSESTPATVPGAASATVYRTGTTAEYGYLIVTEGLSAEALLACATERALAVGGGVTDRAALIRAQAEVSHPVVPEQFTGLNVREAGAVWLTSPDRDDEFLGSAALADVAATRSLIAVRATGAEVPAGAEVRAGETVIGTIHLALPAAGEADGFGLALVDLPFNVPGLDLNADGVALRTVSRPAADPRSWVEAIG